MRPAARAGAPGAIAGIVVAAASAFAALDLADGWRIVTLALAGPTLFAIGARRERDGLATLGLLVASVAYGALVAWVGARTGATDPQRMLAIAAAAAILAVALFEAGARRVARRPLFITAGLDAIAACVLVAVALGATLDHRDVAPTGETLAGAGVLLGLGVALFRAAVLVKSETLAYAGQLALVGFAAFLRLARPDIFASGLFARFWPIFLVLLAFVALGAGTLAARLGLEVLARPLERAAAALALAPAAGVWFVGRAAGGLALFLAAALYGALSASKKEGRFAVLAALFANAGLQPFLLLGGFRYFYQPAVFFGPLGLTLMVAAHLARERQPGEGGRGEGSLSSPVLEDWRDLLRGSGAFLVLASLTFSAYVDLAHRTLESVILAALAIAGAALGVRFRVPAYVRMGAAFLLLDVASHVYWAGRDEPWIWWVSLVALGVAVIAYFATLERRRSRE